MSEDASTASSGGTTSTDCRTEEGVTVGLIDAVITLARVLRGQNFHTLAIHEALKDMRGDEDVRWLLGLPE